MKSQIFVRKITSRYQAGASYQLVEPRSSGEICLLHVVECPRFKTSALEGNYDMFKQLVNDQFDLNAELLEVHSFEI